LGLVMREAGHNPGYAKKLGGIKMRCPTIEPFYDEISKNPILKAYYDDLPRREAEAFGVNSKKIKPWLTINLPILNVVIEVHAGQSKAAKVKAKHQHS